jgi:hypothetical protein
MDAASVQIVESTWLPIAPGAGLKMTWKMLFAVDAVNPRTSQLQPQNPNLVV